MRFPLDLNAFCMAFPLANRSARVLNVPQVNEFTLSSNCNLFDALPFNLEAFEYGIDFAMIKAGYLVTRLARAVPDVDLAHDAACCNQVVSLFAEFALHQVLVKVLCSHNLYISIIVDLPNASHHVSRAREKFIASNVPMDGTHRLLWVVLVGQDVRNLHLLELAAKVLLSQVPEVSDEAVSCRGQQPMLRVEMSEKDLSVLTCLPQVDSELCIVLQRFH